MLAAAETGPGPRGPVSPLSLLGSPWANQMKQISPAQVFLGNFWGKGLQQRKLLRPKGLGKREQALRQALSFFRKFKSFLFCPGLSLPGRTACCQGGKQCGEGLLKGMVLPAVVSERFSTQILTTSAQGAEGEGKMATGSHPRIDFFFF